MKLHRYSISKDINIDFRLLSAEEADRLYQSLMSENVFAEEFVFNLITDNKYNIDELSAGVIPTVVFASLKLSGYFSKYEDILDGIDNARSIYDSSIYSKIFYSKIMKIIPGVYRLEDLKGKSVNELLELYCIAEMVQDNAIYDTKKMREALEETKGINKKKHSSITKEELSLLKAAIQAEEFNGLPMHGI
jgi:hypothetical protein